MKKYELIKEDNTNLLRIKYLIGIHKYAIKAGSLGGLLESEDNLSHEGDCVVLENARVYGNARISENAIVSGDAEVSGNARVFGTARVYENVWVYGNAWVFGNARVSGNVIVSGNARVSGTAWVYGNAKVSGNAEVYAYAWVSNNSTIEYSNITSTVIGIQGSKDYINLDGEYLHIGCQCHKIDYWLENYESIGKDNHYSEAEILEYKEYIDFLTNKVKVKSE